MVLKLDPRFPAVWRSPTSLQFGVSSPPVVLDDVTPADERMLATLAVGVSTSGLAMIGKAAGADEAAVTALLELVAPVLLRPDDRPAATVTMVGSGETAQRISAALRGVGVLVRCASDPDEAAASPCDLAIAIGHFVLAPELHGLWLRRDIPHLPVVFTDSVVSVGPVVEPGVGPCLYCLQRYRTDADPAWPALASQLWGRRSTIESPLVALEVAAIVSRLVVQRLAAGRPAAEHRSTELSVDTGSTASTTWAAHPGCGCIGVDSSSGPVSAAVRAGNDWPAAGRRGTSPRRSNRPPPTTGQASASPA